MAIFKRITVLFVLGIVLAAFMPWTSQLGKDNPLVGKIYSNATFISLAALDRRLATAKYVVLGEVHDNPDHHYLQAQLLKSMVDGGRRPAVVLEMLPRTEQQRLDDYLASKEASAAGFGKALGWEKRGWPPWAMYQPVLQVALDAGLKVIAGNIDRTSTRKVAREGYKALKDAETWGLSAPLPEALATVMDGILMEGHCNMLPKSFLPAMRKVQRARDAAMANAMLEASSDGAVLIAGVGHGRADFGVPYYLGARGAANDWLSISFVPTEDEETNPQSYLAARGGDNAQTVFIFTPRIDDKDHCAELREHLSKNKKSQ